MVGLTLGTLDHLFLELVLVASLCDCSFDRTELCQGVCMWSEKMMIVETKSQALNRIFGTFLMSV